jgi:hypothetical protein
VGGALDGGAEVGDALLAHQMMDVRHEHDAVACGDPEQGDESNVQGVMDGDLDDFVESYLKWDNEVRGSART